MVTTAHGGCRPATGRHWETCSGLREAAHCGQRWPDMQAMFDVNQSEESTYQYLKRAPPTSTVKKIKN